MKKIIPLLMVFTIALSLAIPASAAWTFDGDISDIPDPYTVWTSELRTYYPYAALHELDNYYPILRLYSTSPTPRLAASGDMVLDFKKYTGGVEGVYTYIEFFYNPNVGYWQQNASNSGGLVESVKTMRASSFGVEYGGETITPGGGDFFTIPLPEVIQGVTAETLNSQTVPALGGTMKVLVLCGVGLIALLVVLKLFGKRSLISPR